LPRLVRSMGTTAIGKGPRTTPVGRPNRAALAGAAVAGVLLLSVPLVVLGWNSDKSSSKTEPTAGTVLNDDEADRAGRYEADTEAEPKQEKPKTEKSEAGAEEKPAAETKTEPKEEKEEKSKTEKKEESEKEKKPAKSKAKPGVALGAPMALRGHKSGLCIDVPNSKFNDGAELQLWNCNGGNAQQWRAADDGTLRIGGKCMDVRGSNFSNDTQIQLWNCNGSNAQKFDLNAARDLVNTSVGMCAGGKGATTGAGTKIILFKCTGTDNQKWN
uniref:ricin-type beta-trefoil lectin domain protein n=1 Tax=Streptomyces xiaopingdaonensis TaxID=1565415 RepID=UPI00049438F1